jgi:hypothetical protein
MHMCTSACSVVYGTCKKLCLPDRTVIMAVEDEFARIQCSFYCINLVTWDKGTHLKEECISMGIIFTIAPSCLDKVR